MTLESETQLVFEIKEGPVARTETVEIRVVPLGDSVFIVSWTEKDGAHVTNVQTDEAASRALGNDRTATHPEVSRLRI